MIILCLVEALRFIPYLRKLRMEFACRGILLVWLRQRVESIGHASSILAYRKRRALVGHYLHHHSNYEQANFLSEPCTR